MRGPAAWVLIVATAATVPLASPCSAQPAAPLAAQPACPSPGLTVGRITIERRAVFENAPGDRSPVARVGAFANALHVRTREHVVREELLFREGDPCNEEALAQSERNLRARGLFQTVAIRASRRADQFADVHVVVQDAWTLRLSANLARIGGALVWDVGLADTNLAGQGFGVGVRHREEIDAGVSTVWLQHDRLFGTRERLAVRIDERSDGDARAFSLARPFFAIDSRWAHTVAASRLRDHWRLYDQGEITDESAREADDIAAGLAVRVGRPRPDRAWRLGGGFRFSALEFSALEADGGYDPPPEMPPSHRFAGPYASLQFLQHRFVKRRGLVVPERDTDHNLGWQFDVSGWASLRTVAMDTESRVIVSTALSRGWTPGARGLILATAGVTARSGGDEASNGEATGRLRAWWPHSPTRVTAVAAELRSLMNPEPGYRLYLGGSAGLAGYREFAAAATRTATLQIEERKYLPWTLAGLVQVGVAAFAGAGALGGRVDPVAGQRWLADVGFGLRIAQLKSAATSAARIDIAFPLTAAPDGSRRPLLVFGFRRDF